MRALLLVGLLALLGAGPAAAGELRSERLTRAVAIASGVSSPDVSCETDAAAWDVEARAVGSSGAMLGGYSYPARRRARLAPWVCEALVPVSPHFGYALHVVAGEAGRLAGVSDDGMNGCYGLLWVADLARQVWGIPFFTLASERTIAQAVAAHERYPARYRTICG